ASIVSALISGSRAFRKVAPHQPQALSTDGQRSPTLIAPKSMQTHKLDSLDLKRIDIRELTTDAMLSSKLCTCEGSSRTSRAPIKICAECRHTACSECAGNPTHSYGATISNDERKQTPGDFERKWRPLLPTRLVFNNFPDVWSL